MSETVRLKAKVKRVASNQQEALELLGWLWLDLWNEEIGKIIENNDLWGDYIYIEPLLYRILESETYEASHDDLFEATICNDWTIDIIAQYYNGWCWRSEAIAESLDSIDQRVQYTITEHNHHEWETRWYIVYPTDDQLNQIIDIIDEDEEWSFSIEETNYTKDQVELINKHFNWYMDRLSFGELPEKIDIDTLYKWRWIK